MTRPRGTIVYAADPFTDRDGGRPWVIVNTTSMPFHGDQYVVQTVRTKTWYEDRIPIENDDLRDGGLPEASSILPWAGTSIDPDAIDRELGRVDEAVVDDAVRALARYLGLAVERDR